MNDRLFIIIVNYNGLGVNEECIDSILKSKSSVEKRIIFIDNASKDNSVKVLKKKYGSYIQFIEIGYNSGFAHANNVGINIALQEKADYILLLNNDTVIEKHMIDNMIKCEKRYGEVVVAPKIMNYFNPQIISFAGGYMDMLTIAPKHKHEGKNIKDVRDKEEEISFATGCCILFPRNILKKVKQISEEYFLYYEDADLCEKIIRAGYKIIYCPNALVYHKDGGSTGGNKSKTGIYYGTRNRLIYIAKFYKKYQIRAYIIFFISRFLYFIKWILMGKFDLIYWCCKGISDYFKGNFGYQDLERGRK